VRLVGGLIILFIILGALKVWGNRGRAVKGIVEDRTALAFYLALSTFFFIKSFPFFLGMLFLAFLVFLYQSRNPHNLKETLLAALLGVFLSLFIFVVL
jgi:hypothetical protein